jgi:lysozyme
MFVNGIDVSHFQGKINWGAVAGDPNRIQFAYAKATEGATYTDPLFSTNYAGMKQAGIKRGAYHFFRPAVSVSDQVQNFLRAVGQMDVGDMAPMLDVEQADGQSPATIAGGVTQWLDQVQVALSRVPIIYTFPAFWNTNVGDEKLLNEFPLWIANFTSNPQPKLPAGAPGYRIWQYSDAGKVAGISGNVDLDRLNGSIDDLCR